MIYNYPQNVRDLFYTDSIKKSLTINLSEEPIDLLTYNKTNFDIYKTLSDEDIIAESMEFSEGLSEETQFTFRSFSLPQLSVSRVFEQKDYTGCACTCILSVYNADGTTIAANIMLLSGYVVSDEASDDRRTRKLTCIDSLGQFFEKEIFALSGINKTTMTILDFITAISNATKIQFFKGSYDNDGVLDVAAVDVFTFPELIREVNFSNFNASYTIKDFLQDLAEATGCFLIFHKQNSTTVNNGYIGLDVVLIRMFLDMRLRYPSSTLYPSDIIYPLYEDAVNALPPVTIVHKIDWYINAVISTEPVKPYKYFSVYVGNKKVYTAPSTAEKTITEYKVSNNTLLEKANADEIEAIVYAPAYLVGDLSYFTIKLDMPYLAYLQPGDFIMFESEWGTYVLPIINVQVRGINSLRATVSCELKTT